MASIELSKTTYMLVFIILACFFIIMSIQIVPCEGFLTIERIVENIKNEQVRNAVYMNILKSKDVEIDTLSANLLALQNNLRQK